MYLAGVSVRRVEDITENLGQTQHRQWSQQEEGLRFLLFQLHEVSDEIFVVDNGSTDNTATVARSLARILHE